MRIIQAPEDLALKLLYLDRQNILTARVVSPIRWLDCERFLALCLCRQDPRQFYVGRCLKSLLVPTHELLAPEEIVTWDLDALCE